MATITLTIPDAILPRVIAGMCGHYGYEDTITDPANPENIIPNLETKGEFCRRMVRQHVKRVVLQWEAEQAFLASQAAGESEVNIT